MLTFLAAVFFLIITPGPGVLSTAGVGVSFGARAGLRYVLGLFLGNCLIMVMVISGLAALIFALPGARPVLVTASTAYLVYLAWRIATAGAKLGFIHPARAPGVREGFALQPINPKAYVVNTALFANFPFDGVSLAWETGLKVLMINAIWVPIHLVWLGLGLWLRRLDLPPRVQRGVNFAMAASMLGVVGLSLAAQL
ncbi:MAG: LysE family translocator [Pseudomonadota bacterium]